MSGDSERLRSLFFLSVCLAAVVVLGGVDARGAEAPAIAKSSRWIAPVNPDRLRPAGLTFNATPNVLPIQSNSAIVNMAGDDDGFGFGFGWIPPDQCTTFDNRGPEDLGVFDQRQPTSAFNSICSFVGEWTQSFPVPPGGVGQLTLQMRILGGQGDVTSCAFSPCGCTTPAQTLFINGVQQPFFTDPGCASIIIWTGAWQGPTANALAGSGSLAIQVNWNNDPFAIDYSRVTVLPAVEVAVLDGDGQRGAITNSLEQKLRVKFTSQDPAFNFSGMQAVFQVTSVPARASGYGVGASDTAISTTSYTAPVDSSGVASAVLVLGDKEGQYVIQVKSPLSITGNAATFTETAVKPNSVVILKDSPDLADRAPTYAVSSTDPTTFYAIGLDTSGASLGRVKSNWSLSSGGNPATRGIGSVSPTASSGTTTFTPTHVGHLTISANPTISGVSTGSADLFLTRLYVEVQGFDPNNPLDQLSTFVPGSNLDGTSWPPSAMPQPIRLHLLTGASSRGSVTFSLSNVTNYAGIAMNYPVTGAMTDPDMFFSSGGSTTVGFSGTGDTFATLEVNDYAASGMVNITIKSGKKIYTLPSVLLPVDNDGNHIPDAGWRAENAQINDAGLDPGADEDDTPPMRLALPDPITGVGDALTDFEEYRGFVFMGAHRRLNPFHKDYFIEASVFNNDIMFAYPDLPTSTHQVGQLDYSVFGNVNINYVGLPGATGHQRQNVVRVVDLGVSVFCPSCAGETVCTPGEPHVPVYCSEIRVFSTTINGAYPADPVLLRRATVAHEAGHSINFFDDSTPGCLMYGGSLISTGVVPTEFCTNITTTLDCEICNPPNPIYSAPNFNETDPIRLKP